jgi:hypothetical protein
MKDPREWVADVDGLEGDVLGFANMSRGRWRITNLVTGEVERRSCARVTPSPMQAVLDAIAEVDAWNKRGGR